MRQQYKPNIPAKNSRKSNTSKSTTAESTESSTNEVENNVPFIPPNSSKNTESNVIGEELNSEGINLYSEVVIESVSLNDNGKEATIAAKSSKTKKDNSKPAKSTAVRRSRIKPKVTPVARTRNKSTAKIASNDIDGNGDQSTDNIGDTKDESKDSSPCPQKHQEKPKNNSNTQPKDNMKISENSEAPDTQQNSSTHTSADVNLPASGTSLSRRRRAAPKICIPPRKKRGTSALSEVVDKADETTTGDIVQQREVEKEVPECSEHELPTKRPRLQPENDQDGIGIVEVTVQSDDHRNSSVNNEQHDKDEEEQTQASKKLQGKGKRKRVQIRKPKEMLDPSKMTLQDLIYFNPKENFMKSSSDPKRKRLGQTRNSSVSTENSESIIDEINTDENQSNNQQTTVRPEGEGGSTVSCAPQIKIAADGSIIVDEESLVIRSPTHSTLEDRDIIYEDANDVAHDMYGKAAIRKRWTMTETLKFYKALSQVGTDFQLMVPLFPTRSRKELKAKFKKEEKQNHHLVDRALVHRTPISLEMFSTKDDKKEESSQNAIKKKGRQRKADTEEQTENEIEKQTETVIENCTKNATEQITIIDS